MELNEELDSEEMCLARSRLLEELQAERSRLGADADHLFNSARLARFIRGNNGSVAEAAAHFRKMLRWYLEADMLKKRRAIEGKPWDVNAVEGGPELFQIMCVDASRFTRDGNMLWVQRDGFAQIEKIMSLTDADLVDRMSILCELREHHLDQMSKQCGKLMKSFQIRDLTGLNIVAVLRNRSVMGRLSDVFKIVSTAYPETLAQMVIVNPPAGFNLFWTAVQPMLNDRIKQKLRFIPSGPLDFPLELVKIAGVGVLESLAKLAEDIHRGKGIIDLAPGFSHYKCSRLAPGSIAQWSFAVPPRCSLRFRAVLIDVAEGGRPEEGLIVREVCEAQAVSGVESRQTEPVAVETLVWLAWCNSDSWSQSVQLSNLQLMVFEKAADSSDAIGRNPSSSSIRSRRESRSPTSMANCFPSWCSSFSESSSDDDVRLSSTSQQVRRRKSSKEMPQAERAQTDNVSFAGGWSDGYRSLGLRFAILLLLVAMAHSAGKLAGKVDPILAYR